jgi:hypothetical protein
VKGELDVIARHGVLENPGPGYTKLEIERTIHESLPLLARISNEVRHVPLTRQDKNLAQDALADLAGNRARAPIPG